LKLIMDITPCIQVKVCGLTDVEEAKQCADLGAHAVGFVFYPPSPRCIPAVQAKKIAAALPGYIQKVGVFVDKRYADIMETAVTCGLTAVQLHGKEPPDLVGRLVAEGLRVIKALFSEASPSIQDAGMYPASAFLVECGKGKLPGGNALSWNWEAAKKLGTRFPLILAGGLSPENVAVAVRAADPDAVDVSSGVECRPGRKDIDRVRTFLSAVAACRTTRSLRRIF